MQIPDWFHEYKTKIDDSITRYLGDYFFDSQNNPVLRDFSEIIHYASK